MNPTILPLPARPFVYRMLSRSMPGKVWTVWTGPGGRAACTCPGGWAWGRACYHMKEVLELETSLALRAADEQQALAPVPVVRPRATLPAPVELQAMMIIAKNVPAAAGTAVPKKLNAGQAFAVMLAGWEFGVGPMTALRHIIVVNGRTEPDAQLMMGLCRALEPDIRFDWQEVSPTRASLALWRHGELAISVEYTLADAEASGRLKRPTRPVWSNNNSGDRRPTGEEEFDGPWQTHTALMLAYNAAKMACKLGASDLINAVQGAGGYALEATAAAMDEGFYEPALIGSVDDEPDFEMPRTGPSGNSGGWSSSPPKEQSRRSPPPGPRPLSDDDMRPLISAALGKHRVTGAQLSALVGGSKVADVKAYMNREGLSLDGVMLRAKADHETGEMPETVDGEAREIEEEELTNA